MSTGNVAMICSYIRNRRIRQMLRERRAEREAFAHQCRNQVVKRVGAVRISLVDDVRVPFGLYHVWVSSPSKQYVWVLHTHQNYKAALRSAQRLSGNPTAMEATQCAISK